MCHTDLTQYNKLLVKAILDAQHTFNVIESGGEIEKIPSPLMKVVKKVNNIFKNERGEKIWSTSLNLQKDLFIYSKQEQIRLLIDGEHRSFSTNVINSNEHNYSTYWGRKN